MSMFSRVAVQCLVASVALVSLCGVCYRLHFNLATVALLLMVLVVLASRVGSFYSSIFASIIAALCLAHIAPPAFSFRVADPLDDLAIAAFLVTSFIISSLVSKVRMHAEEALSSVNKKVIEAEERERHQIADVLHENIGQRLNMLALGIEHLEMDASNLAFDLPSRTDALHNQTLELLDDCKALAHELYSPRLEYIGLAAVMSSFCREFGKRKDIEIDFRSEGLPDLIPSDISLCLFRVLQEALHNAVQHSGVRQFNVTLNGKSDEIQLAVSDSGVGVNPETVRKAGGLGLNRMKERLKLVRGTLSIVSQPKRGTTIHARVPLGGDSVRVAG